MNKVRLVGLLMILFLVGSVFAQDSGVGELYSNEIIECPDGITGGLAFNPDEGQLGLWPSIAGLSEVEGETYECGIVVVPENYDLPEGRKLELFYVRLFSTSQSPAPDPVVYLAGGPGSSGSEEIAANPGIYANMQTIRQRRDIIGYDQRGTGYSNYLLCAIYSSTFGVLLEEMEDTVVIEQFEQAMTQDSFSLGVRNAICGAVYASETDVDLSQYNSTVSAQDILALTQTLGASEYNLYGTSYGTRLAQNAMRSTPDHIRSVILDGVLPPSIPNSTVTFASYYEHYQNLFAQCEADPACAEAYPNLGERFATLLDELKTNPLVIDPPLIVDPVLVSVGKGKFQASMPVMTPDFFVGFAIANNILTSGGAANRIPRIILALEEGDIDTLRGIMNRSGQETAPPPNNPLPFTPEQEFFTFPILMLMSNAQIAVNDAGAGVDTQWVSIVINDLLERFVAGEEQSALIRVLLNWSLVSNSSEGAQALIDFADENLSESAAQSANELASHMTHNDVRNTQWVIQDVAATMGGFAPESRAVSSTMQQAVNCNEEIQFTPPDTPQAYLEESPYPQLIIWSAEFNDWVFAACATFPKTLDESVTELVTSDIPTLILSGELDTQTLFSWHELVEDGLSNSNSVNFDNMGHIAAGHDSSICTGDIAAGFLDNPMQEPNISCSLSDTFKINWVLPE